MKKSDEKGMHSQRKQLEIPQLNGVFEFVCSQRDAIFITISD
jgi:hypothetical protein